MYLFNAIIYNFTVIDSITVQLNNIHIASPFASLSMFFHRLFNSGCSLLILLLLPISVPLIPSFICQLPIILFFICICLVATDPKWLILNGVSKLCVVPFHFFFFNFIFRHSGCCFNVLCVEQCFQRRKYVWRPHPNFYILHTMYIYTLEIFNTR